MAIHKVAVIGAGVMGASIAAHISNAGVPVLLLDRVPEHATDRDSIAKTALQKLLKAEPSPFMHPNNARLITPGNSEDHLHQLAEYDWVIEAVIEQPQIKKALYQQLETICPEHCIISSNTSTLPLHLLVAGMPVRFKQRFMISHFFNPPRYMRLLEIVSGPDTRPELLADLRQFADLRLGKDCVQCQDTPGFIGNRIGIFWLQCGLQEAIALGVNVAEADAVMALFGIPKTGVFGLLDLVGLDLIPHVLASMAAALAPEDNFQLVKNLPEIVQTMIAQGLFNNTKGCYE
jgi:3-hydroxyacyl-CoA dehydrogenase